MKSGMLAAESIVQSFAEEEQDDELLNYQKSVEQSWIHKELHQARNFSPAQKKFGLYLASVFIWLDQNIFKGRLPITLRISEPDHAKLEKTSGLDPLEYPKPDGKLTFDRTS